MRVDTSLTAADATRITLEEQRAGAPLRRGFTLAISVARSSSIGRTRTEGSWIEPNPSFKILESPVGTERIEPGPQEDARVESLFVTRLEPCHRLIVVAKRRIDHGNLRSIRIAGTRARLQIAQQF